MRLKFPRAYVPYVALRVAVECLEETDGVEIEIAADVGDGFAWWGNHAFDDGVDDGRGIGSEAAIRRLLAGSMWGGGASWMLWHGGEIVPQDGGIGQLRLRGSLR